MMDYSLLFDGLLENIKSLFGYVNSNYGNDRDKKNLQLDMCLHLAVRALLGDLPCKNVLLIE